PVRPPGGRRRAGRGTAAVRHHARVDQLRLQQAAGRRRDVLVPAPHGRDPPRAAGRGLPLPPCGVSPARGDRLPDPMNRPLLLILALSGLLALGYSSATPVGGAPDEAAHLQYVRVLATQG